MQGARGAQWELHMVESGCPGLSAGSLPRAYTQGLSHPGQSSSTVGDEAHCAERETEVPRGWGTSSGLQGWEVLGFACRPSWPPSDTTIV